MIQNMPLAIRCTCHHSVPPLNASEQGGGECGACAHERGQAEGIARERRACWDAAKGHARRLYEEGSLHFQAADHVALLIESRGPMLPEPDSAEPEP